jgi:hypothetical protein
MREGFDHALSPSAASPGRGLRVTDRIGGRLARSENAKGEGERPRVRDAARHVGRKPNDGARRRRLNRRRHVAERER